MSRKNISQPPPNESDAKGIIYILINEYMPDLVKIGATKDVERHMSSLNSTSVPLPFECFYACTVNDCRSVEKALYDAFKDSRVNERREFFKISPSRVVSILKLLAIEDVTPTKDVTNDKENSVGGPEENQKALLKARSQRPPFNFHMAKIPAGEILTFVNKDGITAKVHDRTDIEYNGKITSLSAAASEILGFSYSAAGARYWMFDDESLDERRKRLGSTSDYPLQPKVS